MTLPQVVELVRPDLDGLESRLGSLARPDVPMVREILDHVLALRGKRVRPILLFLTARLGEVRDREALLWSAAVVELIHTATLLHDDCLDGTTVRRGLPTVNHRWDQQAAILMGDYLFTRSYEILCEYRAYSAIGILSHHTHRMSCGMNREYAQRRNADLSAEDYFQVIDEKTAALFAASCEIGGTLADLPEESIAEFSRFGRDLGFAFQIIDDIFDFTGDPQEIGKPVGSDFRLGFATLPLIHALEQGAVDRAARVREFFLRGDPSDGEWDEVCAFVLETGGVEFARQKAVACAESARDRLAALDLGEVAAPLRATVEFVIARGS
ncbi:MAG: polyprenyl synthetase family protein [Gemmatimonadota bacterium]|nr:polyprenyl synthetase family protein [Gemmatimonadota bacterium]